VLALLDHPVQNDFERHGVRAYAARLEKTAIALPLAILVMHHMVIVIPFDGGLKVVEGEAFFFLGVPFGFFDLADHSTVHFVLFSVSVDI
jgi:hypothetical protein